MTKRMGAEFLGTAWLVFGGCGSAVLAAAFPGLGIGLVGVSLAFGLTVLTMAYAVGHISGGHFNPAVTVGLGGYSLGAGFAAEVALTFFFLIVILGSTDRLAPAGFAPIAIGLALTLIHLVGIPVTNTSVNPARSTAPAVFVGGWALGQLWLFWLAPILGAAVAGAVGRWLGEPDGQ
jgi:aquaporin Z